VRRSTPAPARAGVDAVVAGVRRRLLDGPAEAAAVDAGAVADLARAQAPFLGAAALAQVVDEVLAHVGGLGPVEPLLADPDVTEVMVNGPGPVWVERGGRVECSTVTLDAAAIGHLVEKVLGPLGLRVDRAAPLVDARLPDGSRVNVVVPPLAVDGPCVTIRRFRVRALPLAEVCPPGVADLLAWAMRARVNIVVSGGTGAGKTTLLNSLAAAIPPGERVVTVEDAAELALPGEHVVRLEARPGNADGVGEVRVRDLVRNALRMRPDRILVGEVRGPEAVDMVQAMNTGHEGSLTTCHANSPADALRRLHVMVLTAGTGLSWAAVEEHVAAAVDLVVQVARQPDGTRRVVEVAEVRPPGEDDGDRTRLVADGCGVRADLRRPGRDRRAGPPPLHLPRRGPLGLGPDEVAV